MSWLNVFGLYFRTVKYLRVKQIYHRIRRAIYKPNLTGLSDTRGMVVREILAPSKFPNKSDCLLDDNKFRFLNKTVELRFPNGWHQDNVPLLWLYNLHYFDGLLGKNTDENLKESLVERWILDNSSNLGVPWHPYPLSLRICNWIKWFWERGSEIPLRQLSSLFQQVRFLERTLEYHLLGNHLLENAKAMIFAGYFFGGKLGDRWLALGVKILKSELREQILDDGGHFELSPMYHSIMLDLVLDILHLSKEESGPDILATESAYLTQTAISMSRWLESMCHTDGDIAYFNDSAVGVAEAPKVLVNRAKKLVGSNLSTKLAGGNYLKASGYIRLSNKNALAFFDVAEVGASYLPGHGHADALAIELSLFKRRLLVNTGTSEYGNEARRHYERSTAAHSTVEINGQNSSEIWSGFRVGRRSRVRNVTFYDSHSVSAEHDGYRYLAGSPVHRRTVLLGDTAVTVEDNVDTHGVSYLARFHIHPDVEVLLSDSKNCGYFIFTDGVRVAWKSEADDVSVEANYYAESFGKLVPMKTLVLHRNLGGKTKLVVNWS